MITTDLNSAVPLMDWSMYRTRLFTFYQCLPNAPNLHYENIQLL